MKKTTIGLLILGVFFVLVPITPVLAIDESPPPSTTTTQVGGGQVYCSGPSAPGWNVSLPGGGCGSSSGVDVPATSVAIKTCSALITDYLHMGWNNNTEQVRTLQALLNKNLGIAIPITGTFDQTTFEAVKLFQIKYAKEILAPWGISTPTGFVYKTTLAQINALECL